MNRVRQVRLLREISQLQAESPDGISLKECNDQINVDSIEVEIEGPQESWFIGQKFILKVEPSLQYPFEPPSVYFITPIRHPNVDESTGRICLDLLMMPPEGSWKPNIGLLSLIVSIRLLLAHPNLSDPIRPELVSEWSLGQKEKNSLENQNATIQESSFLAPKINEKASSTLDKDDSKVVFKKVPLSFGNRQSKRAKLEL